MYCITWGQGDEQEGFLHTETLKTAFTLAQGLLDLTPEEFEDLKTPDGDKYTWTHTDESGTIWVCIELIN